MEHLQAYRAADIGKRHGNKVAPHTFARRLIFAVVTLFAASVFSSASHAQSGPFAGLAGTWSGGGSVTLDDGSSERIRCRATYAVGEGGAGLNQSLTCASDSYKFALSTNVTSQGGAISGSWSETSRNINGMIQGRGSNGSFEVVATAPGFSANISLTTRGNKQSVVIRPDSQFKGASISLTRS